MIREGHSSVSKPMMALLPSHLRGQCLEFYNVGRKLLWDFSAEMHVPWQSMVSTYCLQLNLQETTSTILASPRCEAKPVNLPGFPQACVRSATTACSVVLAVSGDAASGASSLALRLSPPRVPAHSHPQQDIPWPVSVQLRWHYEMKHWLELKTTLKKKKKKKRLRVGTPLAAISAEVDVS